MTKDRRLGRGLAALLGSPLEEDSIVDAVTVAKSSGASGASQPSKLSAPAAPPVRQDASSQLASSQTASANSTLQGYAQVTGSSSSQPIGEPELVGKTLELSVYDVDNNPFQPRRKFNKEEIAALGESIREHEQLQPILVRRVGSRFQLISGERRLRAAIHAGLKTIRAEVREADDRLVAELAIVENLQRKDLDAIEKAMSFRRYIDEHRCTQEDLAKRLKIDRSTIANLMRLLELPEDIQQAIQADEITAGHARALLPLSEERQQLDFAKLAKEEGWSVRETERRVSEQLMVEDGAIAGSTVAARAANRKRVSPQLASLEQRLRLALGTKTEIKQNTSGRGKITITFANNDEFERICSLICPEVVSKSA